MVEGGRHHCGDRVAVRDVRLASSDLRRQVRKRLRVDIAGEHPRALLEERLNHRAPDSGRARRHQHAKARDSEIHPAPSL